MRKACHAALPLAASMSVVAHGQRAASDDRAAVLQSIDAKRTAYADVARQIWTFAEVGYQEQKSSALLQSPLKSAAARLRHAGGGRRIGQGVKSIRRWITANDTATRRTG
jgi:aminobenzoyl-glutamate utilization protein B